MSVSQEQKQGVFYAVAAFVMWGFAPVYFKSLDNIDSLEILFHRVIWSCAFLLAILLIKGQWYKVQHVIKQPKLLGMLVITSLFLGVNWGLFIWAVNNDHMLDASLGYYINPLFNVLLGMVFLGERLRLFQGIAVGLATTGVLIQVISFGSFPYIAFSLAGTFAIYGLLRKKLAVESLPGLLLESLVLLPLALYYGYFHLGTEMTNFGETNWTQTILLISAGIVTTAPLLCFTAAAKRLKYSTLGFFQYIGPSLMFILAVGLYGESVGLDRLVTFIFIWTALTIYSWDAFRASKQRK